MNIPAIPPVAENARILAEHRQAVLTKPAGALGDLENLSIRLAGMVGRLDWQPMQRAVIVCAGDHGVTGVSAYPKEVTRQMVLNFLSGGAAVNVLARQMDARVCVVDAGVIGDFDPHPSLIQGKIGHGTADFSREPAMTQAQTEAAIQLGLDVAEREIEYGLDLLAVGEMGIGNTSSASAIIAAITGKHAGAVTGRGTGLDDAGFERKIETIQHALELHEPAHQNTLMKVGGFEIGAMAGLIIGAASARIPVVLDGLICTAAALIAVQLAPRTREYMIASHQSAEPGHAVALAYLGLKPLLSLGLRLGEGTGALLAFPLIEASMRLLQQMATFDDAGVSGKT